MPSIFVFERDSGEWELIDGLQRVSTILEFMGLLLKPEGGVHPPSILEATKYLPSLHNAVWEVSDSIAGTPIEDQNAMDKALRLAIRRSRIGVEILKRSSDNETKFDLFQRLNAGGTQANAQELRNCIMLMVNADYFRAVKAASESHAFRTVTAVTEDQFARQHHMELAVRFLVHTCISYNGTLDVEEYVDEGIVQLATQGDVEQSTLLISRTFDLLNQVAGKDVLRRRQDGIAGGKVGLVGLEGIAVGVAKNLEEILALDSPIDFVDRRINEFWNHPDSRNLTSPGLRGTVRIRRTVPFGEERFRP